MRTTHADDLPGSKHTPQYSHEAIAELRATSAQFIHSFGANDARSHLTAHRDFVRA